MKIKPGESSVRTVRCTFNLTPEDFAFYQDFAYGVGQSHPNRLFQIVAERISQSGFTLSGVIILFFQLRSLVRQSSGSLEAPEFMRPPIKLQADRKLPTLTEIKDALNESK